MTIEGWIAFGIIALFAVIIAIGGCFFVEGLLSYDTGKGLLYLVRFGIIVLAGVVIFVSYMGLNWYFTETATGRRAVVDQRSEFNNGLERTINILNADGEVIRTYTGIIDIEGNDGGYVLFDYNGKRYTYYNCYLESIADIEK